MSGRISELYIHLQPDRATNGGSLVQVVQQFLKCAARADALIPRFPELYSAVFSNTYGPSRCPEYLLFSIISVVWIFVVWISVVWISVVWTCLIFPRVCGLRLSPRSARALAWQSLAELGRILTPGPRAVSAVSQSHDTASRVQLPFRFQSADLEDLQPLYIAHLISDAIRGIVQLSPKGMVFRLINAVRESFTARS
jgi:hypothetical protein